jgi:sodium/potassium-transporting ATPase subunit alpha
MCDWLFESKEAKEAKAKELRKNVEMTEHSIDLEELLARYESNVQTGISAETAQKHFLKYGKNELTPPATTPWYVKFIQEMTGFFSLLLWGASAACFISYSLIPEVENLYLGIVLAAVVWVTGCFSYLQNRKSDNMMAEFKAMRPPKVKVCRGGENMLLDSSVVTIGDIVMLEQGDLVPADIRVIECSPNMCVDNSSLTGESEPQKRKPECTNEEVLETANLCFFGTQVPEGSCRGVVVKIADETVIGRIAKLALSTEAEQTPINKEIHRFIFLISGIAIVLGVSFFCASLAMGQNEIASLVFMIGIIVANVPEGLLATVTVCLTLTAKRMYSKKVMVKNLEGVETLGSTSCICSDKTGTLTQNIMTIAQCVYAGGRGDAPDIQDCGSSFTKGVKTYDGDAPAFQALLTCSTLCNTCYFEKYWEDEETGKRVLLPFSKVRTQGDGSQITEIQWRPVGNASEGAMIKFAHPTLNECMGVKDIEDMRRANAKVFDIPFNSKNKYQVHVHCTSADASTDTNDRIVYMKGAPERVLMRCTEYMNNDGSVVPMTPELAKQVEANQETMGNNGLRVLGFAMKKLPFAEYGADYPFSDGREERCSTANFPLGESAAIEAFEEAKKAGTVLKDEKGKPLDPPHPKSGGGLVFLGLMALVDPPREAVPGAVAKCKTAGIKVIMVTGDHPGTAKAIAYKVGILWSPTAKDIEAKNAENGVAPGDVGYEDPDGALAIVCPGWEFSDDMGDDKWDKILEHPQIVFARTSPQQKLVIVSNCQRLGHVVAVTGDGVNDSPALKKADIGIAMGIAGTPVTKNAADMILLDDNFASIVAGVEEGRLIFDNLKKSICYTLTSNIPEISPFLCWITLSTPMPLSTVLILAIDLGTDMVPAISMAYEDAEADIMKRPPRNSKTDHLVTSKLICLAYLQIGVMQAMAGFYAWMLVLNDYGFPPTILMGNPSGTGLYFGEQTMFCKFNGGQYVNEAGEIDQDRNPSTEGPKRSHPLWDRGDGGYIKKCSFAMKNFKGGGETPDRKFKYTQANTYTEKTYNFAQPTVEAMWALESKQFFEYSPWRGRLSPFWNDKWVAWNIERAEIRIAKAKAGAFGRQGKVDGISVFNYQPAGLWSICLRNNYALGNLGEKNTKMPPLSTITSLYKNFDVSARTEFADWSLANGGTDLTCTGTTGDANDGHEMFEEARFCNGGYTQNLDGQIVADGEAACGALDSHTQNLKYCFDACSSSCDEAITPEERIQTKSSGGRDVFQCQNIASRMIQKKALMHAQAAYWVSIVVVQWADLLICKTRWLSIRQQGLRNSVLNFGLFFETLLAAWLCYGGIFEVLGTQPIRFTHWMPGIPWSMMIFMYDETRKYLMRATSPETSDPITGAIKRQAGWIEKATYY